MELDNGKTFHLCPFAASLVSTPVDLSSNRRPNSQYELLLRDDEELASN
jgi:hypothetical protein